jgi:hypothetical protein
MKIVSSQVLIGAFVAAVLMFGAGAAPSGGTTMNDAGLGQWAPVRYEAVAQMTAALESGYGLLLDAAFDVFGEIAAHLKHL